MAKKVNKTIARGLAIKMIDNTENPEQLRDLAVNSLTELYLSDNRFFRMDKDIPLVVPEVNDDNLNVVLLEPSNKIENGAKVN